MKSVITTKITSMEVAQMVGKQHNELLKDIRKYCEYLDEGKIPRVDFFAESTYTDAKGESRPCFMVTKKGCEFIAHKLTGQKGTEFTARYINRFHEMEDGQVLCALNPNIALGVANLGRVTERIMRNQGSEPYKIAEAFEMQCRQFGITLPEDFVNKPKYQQLELTDIEKANKA